MWYMGGKFRQSKAIAANIVSEYEGSAMRYMGGKFRQSKAIAANIAPEYGGGAYVEPFVGAFGVAEKIVPALYAKGCRDFRLSDKSQPIIDLWHAVLFEGWEPPDWVPETQYAEYSAHRHNYIDGPMFAWCGYGLSFGGKWFGGFARGGAKGQSSEKMQLNQKKALLRKRDAVLPYLKHVSLTRAPYQSANIQHGSVVYCDPPYADRTKAHHATGDFDHDEFWGWCREVAKNSVVFVTEFTVPEGVEVFHDWGDTVVRHNNSKGTDGTCEVLVQVGPKERAQS